MTGPRIVGTTLTFSDHPVTVIGVAPPEADFLQDGVELWVPEVASWPQAATVSFPAGGNETPHREAPRNSAEALKLFC